MISPGNPIQAQDLRAPNIEHGFFTRFGGVSSGIYRGLNVGLGSRDNRDHVMENRRRVAETFNVDAGKLTTPYQVHSADVLAVNKPWEPKHRPKVDALVTNTPGIPIGILTADCGPVLFADGENRVVGAAHAGWKGATTGILQNTISAMETLGAERNQITAVLGPTISQDNYEVGPEFVDRLLDMQDSHSCYFKPSDKKDHAMFDLPGFIVDRLKEEGVAAFWTGNCTYADEDQFFSYRRTTHRKEEDYGRQVSAISIGD